ncbi:Mu transposase domain-containing protein [Cryobacterium breve]|uniref:Mu transposase domain-containing protein n=1 Tax=Cryobacterium breve TaxID=1259258 RepID=UPI003BAEFA1A
MLALPPVAPLVGFAARVRLPRDYSVRVHGNDYSVDPAGIGRTVEVRADLDQVTVTLKDRSFASHNRAWSPRHVNAFTGRRPRHFSATITLWATPSSRHIYVFNIQSLYHSYAR